MPKDPNKYCAVLGCESPGPSFFSLPRDPATREEWIRLANNPKIPRGLEYRTSHRICSRHFKRADFVHNMQSEMLGTKSKPTLRPGALPVLYLPLDTGALTMAAAVGGGDATAAGQAEDKMSVQRRKELVNSALAAYETEKAKESGLGEGAVDVKTEIDDGSPQSKVGKYISARVDALLEQNARLVGQPYTGVIDSFAMSGNGGEDDFGSKITAIGLMKNAATAAGDNQMVANSVSIPLNPIPAEHLGIDAAASTKSGGKGGKRKRSNPQDTAPANSMPPMHHATNYVDDNGKPISAKEALEKSKEILRNTTPLKPGAAGQGTIIHARMPSAATAIQGRPIAPIVPNLTGVRRKPKYTPTYPHLVRTTDGFMKYAVKGRDKGIQCTIERDQDAKFNKSKWMRTELERQKKVIESQKHKIRMIRTEMGSSRTKSFRKQIVLEELTRTSKLTEPQIKCLLNKSMRVQRWDLRSVVMPLIQYAISSKAYYFATQTSVVPMPSVSSLKNWQTRLQTDPALLKEALSIIDEDNDFEPNYVREKFLSAVKGNSDINLSLDDVIGTAANADDDVTGAVVGFNIKQEATEEDLELGVDEDEDLEEDIDEEILEGQAVVGEVIDAKDAAVLGYI